VNTTPFVAVAIALAACGAHAQEALPQVAPAAPAQPPVAAPAQPPGAPVITRDRLQRIYLIRQYESVLTNAVKTGANSLASQLKLADPTSLFVTGSARARGFELEGYGVVFDVDVPTMMQSVLWSAQVVQRQQEMDRIRDIIADPRTPDGMRRIAQQELGRLQRLTNNLQAIPAMPVQPIANPRPGEIIAAVAPDLPDPRTADEMYTDTIKSALIEAMLSFGPVLRLGDDEWLTIAARAATPAVPNQLDDSSSIVIRIKGADLAAYMAKQLSREDVLKKIEIKEG
jgi:hypothetical protein